MTKPNAKVSKWAEWARKRRAKHLCVRCGKKTRKHILCDKCHETELARKRMNRRAGIMRSVIVEEAIMTGPTLHIGSKPLPIFLETEPLTEAAPILSEICERLHELEDLRLGLAVDVLTRLMRICEISHTAFRYTIRLMHGDATIFNSFQEQAESRAMSKQAAHAEFHTVLATIERAFPELAHQIGHIRGQVSRPEEKAPPHTNRQGIVITAERTARHEL